MHVIRDVLAEPLFWVATNAGYDGQAVIDQVRTMPAGHGLNALSGEFGDLFESGVIDPLKVTRLTLQHAASVAALMLTTEALVAEELVAQPGAVIAPGFETWPRGWPGPPRRSRTAARGRRRRAGGGFRRCRIQWCGG